MAKNYQLIHKLNSSKQHSSTQSTSRTPTTTTTSIYVGTHLANRESVTIKITDLEDVKDIQLTLNEIFHTKNLRHVNILPILNCFVQNSQLWCVYPFTYFGSCRDILDAINSYYTYGNVHEPVDVNHVDTLVDRADEQKRLCFNEQSLQPITKSILNALDYLHSRHIVHRCICPEHIFITHTGHVYLGGLSFSVSLLNQGHLSKKLHDYPSNIQEHLNYISPEILQQNLIGYNSKSDIYSLGVTLCELANGVNPFIGCEKAHMLFEKLAGYDVGLWDRNILTPESKNLFISVCATENPKVIASVQRRYFSDKFRNFVDLCVQRNYELRPGTGELLQHAYLKKMKLQTCLSTFQMSIIADGLTELQLKCNKTTATIPNGGGGSNHIIQTNSNTKNAAYSEHQTTTTTTNNSTDSNNNRTLWNF